jgi:hypothetical protein
MTRATISVHEETLKRTRMRALGEGTSLDAVVRDDLETYAGRISARREAWERIQDIARRAGIRSEGEPLPQRDELYDRPISRSRPAGS